MAGANRFAKAMRDYLRHFLGRIGRRVSVQSIQTLNSALNCLEVGRWIDAHGYRITLVVRRREELFDLVARQLGQRQTLYLEFGVWTGAATRYWSKLLRNPDSVLHGFDSFEGLPEDWNSLRGRGAFSANGKIPHLDDTRVEFFKGLFEQTLPEYKCPRHDALILNMDADLYASTIFVLDSLRSEIVPGTYIYFDEFADREHELRAFDEFVRKTGWRFSLLGLTYDMKHVMFQRLS